jgi:hypothetical protein
MHLPPWKKPVLHLRRSRALQWSSLLNERSTFHRWNSFAGPFLIVVTMLLRTDKWRLDPLCSRIRQKFAAISDGKSVSKYTSQHLLLLLRFGPTYAGAYP